MVRFVTMIFISVFLVVTVRFKQSLGISPVLLLTRSHEQSRNGE